MKMPTYRRCVLILFASFFGYLLWKVIGISTVASSAAIWPLVTAILIVLMLPEERLQGDLFVRLVEALKGDKG